MKNLVINNDFYPCTHRIGNLRQRVEPDAEFTVLDAGNMRLLQSAPLSQLRLGQVLILAQFRNPLPNPQPLIIFIDSHVAYFFDCL